MLTQISTIIITSDEPYGNMKHTQLLYAEYLSNYYNVVYIAPPKKWRYSNLFGGLNAAQQISPKLTVLFYHNYFPAFLKIFNAFNELRNEIRIAQFISKKENNILVWHFDSYRSALNTGHLGKGRIIKRIYHVIDPFYNNPLDRFLCELSDLIVLTSPRNTKFYNDFSEKVIVQAQGLDLQKVPTEIKTSTKTESKEKYFVLLGTISIDLDFDWLKSLVNELNVGLILIGKKIPLGTKENEFAELLIHPKVSVLSEMPPEEFYPILKNASAGLIMYNTERRKKTCSPLKALNYLAAGIPVISNIETEIPTLLTKGIFIADNVSSCISQSQQALAGNLVFETTEVEKYLKESSLQNAVDTIFMKLALETQN